MESILESAGRFFSFSKWHCLIFLDVWVHFGVFGQSFAFGIAAFFGGVLLNVSKTNEMPLRL